MWKLLLIASLAHVSGGPLLNSPSSANWFSPFQFSGGACNCPSSSTVLDQDGSPVGVNQPMPMPFGVSNAGTNFYQNFVVAGAVPSAGSLASAKVQIRDDYTYTPGVGAHKFHTKVLSWNEARKSCNDEGGHLAVINSIAEAEVLGRIYKNSKLVTGATHNHVAWLGFHDLFKQGEWVTIFAKTLAHTGYEVWARDQPNNAGGQQHCGALDKSGGLNDVPCADLLTYFCEHTTV